MKKPIFALCVLFLFGCHNDPEVTPDNPPNLRALTATEMKVSGASNDFAFTLFRAVQEEPDLNVFLSPFSVSMALAMVLNGAEGETQQSILNTIDYGDMTAEEVNQAYRDLTSLLLSMDRTVNLGIANSVWYSDEFHIKEAFSTAIGEYYDGKVTALDFSNANAKNTINNWIEDKTNNRIQNMIQSISPSEVMFLVNAIYFKGDWTYQFQKSETHKADFTTTDGATTDVDMMHADGVKMLQHYNEELMLLDIPYGNEQFRLTLLVPHQPDKLESVAAKLSSEVLSAWLGETDSISVELELPKFTMKWKKELKPVLSSMGMNMKGFPNLFEENLPLEISRVTHQSFVEVSEKGTEAAAVTVIGVELTSFPPTPPRITIDRPFIFLIREKQSNAILFMGQLTNPAAL